MGDEMQATVDNMEHMYALMQQLNGVTHDMVGKTKEMVATTNELRDHIADFDDFFPADPQLFLLGATLFRRAPACYALRSIFDALDGIDKLQ